ncbi:MAG TPA: hypothetical protein VF266_19580 [Thermoanaerobaculia bacterium]
MLNMLLLLLVTMTAPQTLLRSDAPAIEVETIIRPVTHDRYQLLDRVTPGMYRCEVLVHDEPGSNRIWGTSDLVVAPGGSAEKSVTLGTLRMDARVTLTRAKDRASTRVTIYRDGKVIHRQTSTVSL